MHGALKLTYFDPGRTQQETAELLKLPFSTYRRHLGCGVERICRWLWQRELDGYELAPGPVACQEPLG